jgi:hypothetical protein
MMDHCESIRGERRLLALFLGLNWLFFSQVTLELTCASIRVFLRPFLKEMFFVALAGGLLLLRAAFQAH